MHKRRGVLNPLGFHSNRVFTMREVYNYARGGATVYFPRRYYIYTRGDETAPRTCIKHAWLYGTAITGLYIIVVL